MNPDAEELTYSDQELLEALGCVSGKDKSMLNLAGVLVFGSSKLQRRVVPTVRVDYIRVPGTTWTKTFDEFRTIDMRGPLILLLYKLIDAVNSDLPDEFKLRDGDVQADGGGFPSSVLREAIVNALMHCSYRGNRPTQIIRYDNRIEITNAGYSLKDPDALGNPGSELRNKIIAPIFHDTKLAETKGSGIRRMRTAMRDAGLAQPTFESDREHDTFTVRLLLHHFLGDSDLRWLSNFRELNLSDDQKMALVFVREVGAIDNLTYRQMSGVDTLQASRSLIHLRESGFIIAKGKGSATYYVSGPLILHGESQILHGEGQGLKHQDIRLPAGLRKRLDDLPKKVADKEIIPDLIVDLCRVSPMTKPDLIKYLKRSDTYMRDVLGALIKKRRIRYLYPQMVRHPNQAYVSA